MKPFELCHECAERLRTWIADQEAQETQEKHIPMEDEIRAILLLTIHRR